MTLNLTLLAQMVHFLIAYWFLRKWLFAPIFRIILAQEQEQMNAEQLLADAKARAVVVQREKQEELRACVSYFNSNKPAIEEQSIVPVAMPDPVVTPLTNAEREALQQELVSVLIKKVQT
jgi:hypothetical protein